MKSPAIRFFVCLLALMSCTRSVLSGQNPAQPDIYEHFVGVWAGTSAFVKNGVRRESSLKITITETKHKDGLRLDYDYAKTATADRDRYTRFLKLDPAKSTFNFSSADSSGRTIYTAEGLAGFLKSRFGKFSGWRRSASGQGTVYQDESIESITFVLTKDEFSYDWADGPDADHTKIYSLFKLTRVPEPTS